jgi:DNA repair photolyase
MEAFNQPVALITKSSLIERDIDVLSAMAKRNLVHVAISITTQDHQLSRYLEPRATASARRFETIRRLSAAGIPVSLNIAPVIPFLTDHELEQLIARGHASGISTAGYALLRLPWELKTLFRDWLEQHVPLKASHVMSRIQAMRSGRDNDPDFGSRMVGEGLLADLLERRFRLACRRHGLNDRGRQALRRLDKSAFRVPRGTTQGELF